MTEWRSAESGAPSAIQAVILDIHKKALICISNERNDGMKHIANI